VDNDTPELIEQKMEQTRESLTEKVSQLEQQVVGTIQSASDAVQDSVESVKTAVADTMATVSGGVKESVNAVSDGVKEALNMSKHVREHPLPMLGGAVVAGLITGWLLFRRSAPASPVQSPVQAFVPMSTPVAPVATPRPAWLNDLIEIAGREVKKLAEHAIARASSSVQKGVEEGIPKLIDRAMPEVPTVHPRGYGVISRS
jgi:ElaB/YqjD/DUF883 family membrane-anchored ribosome-binding protein